MIVPDTNILVYALQPLSTRYTEYREWLDDALTGDELVALDDSVTTGFLRIVTNGRIFKRPESIDAALANLDRILAKSSVLRLESSARRWSTFERLCRDARATGNAIPDAYLAAGCIEMGATLVTADRGFERFPGLRRRHPLDG